MLIVLQSLTLFSLAYAGTFHHVPTPEFSLLRENSGSPVVAVHFPNGHSDTMILTPLDDAQAATGVSLLKKSLQISFVVSQTVSGNTAVLR